MVMPAAVWFCSVIVGVSHAAANSESALLHDLLMDYNVLARPVINSTGYMDVTLGLVLQQLIDVDEKNEKIETNIWIKMTWQDMFLRWNPADYGGITELRLPPDMVWKPDVLLYNSVDRGFYTFYQPKVTIDYNGSILWMPPGIVKSSCEIDIVWFPFDIQNCPLKFGCWTYGGNFIMLHKGPIELDTYMQNGEWELRAVTGVQNNITYECCPGTYYDITFTITLQRRTLYYGFNLLIPCVLIALITLLDFILPPDSGEKLTLGITVFMSLCVFLLMVAENMPPTSDALPLIGVYFSSVMIIVSASQVFTVLCLNFHHRNPEFEEMPKLIRIIFLEWLPVILMMETPDVLSETKDGYERLKDVFVQNHDTQKDKQRKKISTIRPLDDNALRRIRRYNNALQRPTCRPTSLSNSVLNCVLPRTAVDDLSLQNQCQSCRFTNNSSYSLQSSRGRNAFGGSEMTELLEGVSNLEFMISNILKHLKYITKKVAKEEQDKQVARQWKYAAMVLDRLCLFLFSISIVVITCGIIFSAKDINVN